jgi:hypothetical protein
VFVFVFVFVFVWVIFFRVSRFVLACLFLLIFVAIRNFLCLDCTCVSSAIPVRFGLFETIVSPSSAFAFAFAADLRERERAERRRTCPRTFHRTHTVRERNVLCYICVFSYRNEYEEVVVHQLTQLLSFCLHLHLFVFFPFFTTCYSYHSNHQQVD